MSQTGQAEMLEIRTASAIDELFSSEAIDYPQFADKSDKLYGHNGPAIKRPRKDATGSEFEEMKDFALAA